ncbi:hypothetical protein A6R68_08654, partial [Neotoma lepida]
ISTELKVRPLRKTFAFERQEEAHVGKKEYRQMYKIDTGMARLSRRAGNFYVPTKPKSGFVIRTQDIYAVGSKVCKASVHMLRIVEPYNAWEYPNMTSINELIYRPGDVKISK